MWGGRGGSSAASASASASCRLALRRQLQSRSIAGTGTRARARPRASASACIARSWKELPQAPPSRAACRPAFRPLHSSAVRWGDKDDVPAAIVATLEEDPEAAAATDSDTDSDAAAQESSPVEKSEETGSGEIQQTRVVLSNVPFEMEEAQIMSVYRSFGPVRAQRLLRRNGSPRDRVWLWLSGREAADKLIAAVAKPWTLSLRDEWGHTRHIKAALSQEEQSINPPRPYQEVFAGTARLPGLGDTEYDKTLGLIEGFDRVMAGEDVHSVLKDMGEELPAEEEAQFKLWEGRVKEFNSDLTRETLSEELALSWNLPPLCPTPPNLIAKQKRLAEEAEAADHIPTARGGVEGEYTTWLTGSWQDTIINTDRTQKVVKGGTIVSARALVVTGNGRGTAGFGIGKGPSEKEAVSRAMRNSRKDLQYVERYKGSGILHDLYGKHNSCRVYITRRPPGAGLNAGPITGTILKSFGITDASAKAVGRRNPFSVVYATFNAIYSSRGIQDIAMARGKRILSLHKYQQTGIPP